MELFQFGMALIFYYAFHSFLAHKKTKNILIDKWIPQKFYRIIYNISAIGLLIPFYFFYKKITPNLVFENEWFQLIGLLEIGLGIVLLFLSLRQYNLSEFVGTQQYKNQSTPTPQKLNTEGLNKWVRHPLYFSTLLLVWGFFLWITYDVHFVIALVTTIYLYFGTKLEEEKLIEEFGEAYLIYQKEVPMLIPFLK